MKIFKNLGAAALFMKLLSGVKPYRKNAVEARAKGDLKTEAENLAKCELIAGEVMKNFLGDKLHIEGSENIPKDRAFAIVANHQGDLDPVLIATAMPGVPMGFIAKDDLKNVRIIGKLISDVRGVFIARNNPREALKAINEGVKNLEEGFSMVIFPEGTRSRTGEVQEFKKGSLKMATKPGVPVLPVVIEGSHRLFEDQEYLCPAEVYLKILKPIETADLEKTVANELAEKAEEIIKEELANIRSEKNE